MRTLLAAAIVLIPVAVSAQSMKTGDSPADHANMQAMQKMHHDMPTKGSGDPDRDFVTMMTPHHQGAIEMAKVELQYGKDPALKEMARTIIEAQEKEIAAMDRWKAQHP